MKLEIGGTVMRIRKELQKAFNKRRRNILWASVMGTKAMFDKLPPLMPAALSASSSSRLQSRHSRAEKVPATRPVGDKTYAHLSSRTLFVPMASPSSLCGTTVEVGRRGERKSGRFGNLTRPHANLG